MSSIRGRFVWYDLQTTDIEGAIAFYTALIGYGTQQFAGGGMPYTMFEAGGHTVGGVMPLPEDAKKMGAPPNWMAYIGCDDIDATVARTKDLGGDVLVPPTEIPNMGQFAVLCDPQGAVFAVYGSTGEMPPQPARTQGDISWHELATTGWKAAFEFYHSLFGWNATDAMDMGGGNMYQMFGPGEAAVGGVFDKPAEMPMPCWLYYIYVTDVNGTVEKAKELGAQLMNGPMEVPGGDLVAQLVDPQGAMFAIHGPAPTA